MDRYRIATFVGPAAFVLVWAAPGPGWGESVRWYNLEGFGRFLDGNPESTAVTEDGAVRLPPESRQWYADPAATFSAATAWKNEVVVARALEGEVLAVGRAGKPRPLFKAEAGLVTALAVVGKHLYVATAPPAKIYRVDAKQRVEELEAMDAAYIWAMIPWQEGGLLCATGEPGAVWSIDKRGKPKSLFSSPETHVRSLAYNREHGIFAGGGERGILYRGHPGKRFRALFDSNSAEITSIVIQGEYAYVSAVSGAEALVEPSESEQSSGKHRKAGEVNSQLVQVGMDGTSELLAGSSDEAIFALTAGADGVILVAAGATGRSDPRGRIYSVQPLRREISMIHQSPSRRISHLVRLASGSVAAVAGAGARITFIGAGHAPTGEFFTLPFDTGTNSLFGILQIFGTWPKGTSVTAALRTGHTADPDDTWSEWSKEVKAPGSVATTAPQGRHMQVRVTLNGTPKLSPTVNRVRLAYQRQNLPPFVREVVALRKGLELLAVPTELPKSKTIQLGEQAGVALRRGEEIRLGSMVKRARQVDRPGALTVKWVAEDPNGDELRFDLMFRGANERGWRTLEKELKHPFCTFSSAQFPDGHYQFKVRATDAPSNPAGREREDVRESAAVLIDNTPPTLDPLQVAKTGRRVILRAKARDGVGPLVEAEYSLDAGPMRPAEPDDGVLDGPGESFTVHLGELAAGRHIFTLRVVDEADNESTGEVRFQVP